MPSRNKLNPQWGSRLILVAATHARTVLAKCSVDVAATVGSHGDFGNVDNGAEMTVR